MKNTNIILSFSLVMLSAALLTVSCGRTAIPDNLEGDNLRVNFTIGIQNSTVLGGDGTKAAMLGSTSTLNSIFVSGWDNDSGHGEFIPAYMEFDVSGGTAATDIRWTKPLAKQFYAYANLPASASVANTSYSSQMLTYTVPVDAAQQNDILMAATAADGSVVDDATRSATLNFQHPLTVVEFHVGDIVDLTKITKISIDGVYASGSVTQKANGTFAAWSASGSQTVYQNISGNLPAKGSAVGVPFILIPQSAAKFAVTIEAVDNNGNVSLLGEIAATGGNTWTAGKKNIVTIDFDSRKQLTFTTKLADWSEGESDEGAFDEEFLPEVEFVEIAGLKWATQNLAISSSGRMSWKGKNSTAVKVPGTDKDVIVGDYFPWAAHAGYCGYETDIDKGLLFYTSFTNSMCVGCGNSDKIKLKSGQLVSPYEIESEIHTIYSKYLPSSLTTLEQIDDAASVIYNNALRIPSSEEIASMINATFWAWDASDQGYYVFSPTASHVAGNRADSIPADLNKSDALLFFPATGWGLGGFYYIGYGSYWSRDLSPYDSGYGEMASCFRFGYDRVIKEYDEYRSYGSPIRPVFN